MNKESVRSFKEIVAVVHMQNESAAINTRVPKPLGHYYDVQIHTLVAAA